jgi:hypothetical protein
MSQLGVITALDKHLLIDWIDFASTASYSFATLYQGYHVLFGISFRYSAVL